MKQNSKQTDYTFSDINLVCSIENVFINNILKRRLTAKTQDFGSCNGSSILFASAKIRLQIGSNGRPAETPVVEQSIAAVTIKEDKSPWIKVQIMELKDRQVSLIKNLLVRTRRYLISPINTAESRGIKETSSLNYLSSLKFEIYAGWSTVESRCRLHLKSVSGDYLSIIKPRRKSVSVREEGICNCKWLNFWTCWCWSSTPHLLFTFHFAASPLMN